MKKLLAQLERGDYSPARHFLAKQLLYDLYTVEEVRAHEREKYEKMYRRAVNKHRANSNFQRDFDVEG